MTALKPQKNHDDDDDEFNKNHTQEKLKRKLPLLVAEWFIIPRNNFTLLLLIFLFQSVSEDVLHNIMFENSLRLAHCQPVNQISTWNFIFQQQHFLLQSEWH